MSVSADEMLKYIQSFPIGPAKLEVNSRVVYRASAGCVDRRGFVTGFHKTLINHQPALTYSVRLDPIVVNSNSIQVRSDGMYDGKDFEPASRVIFTEQEVWNDDESSLFLKFSSAIVIECIHGHTYKIQLDNVRAQNEMIRKEQQSDTIDISEPMAVSKESINHWDEEAVQIFYDFSEYIAELRLAVEKAQNTSDISRNQREENP